VGVLLAEDHDGRYWILDVERGRWDSFQRENVILNCARRDTRAVEVGFEQEPGSSGKDSAIQSVRRLAGFSATAVLASGSKEARAYEFSRAVNAGLVYLPERVRRGNGWAGWAKDFVDELTYWPHSKTLDQIDAAAGAYNMILQAPVRVGGLTPSGQWQAGRVS
jgi:predicted phage terminase large subunit-like protein